MASDEHPLKKRKLYDPFHDHPHPHPHPHPHLHSNSYPPHHHPTFSQEEILRRRRNREEIRSLYDCYRRIKFCASQKDARLMPDIEQAYLSLITASRGCTSLQCLVAELIPRYASYCPTALEAAAKVSINMYSWSLAIIMRGEDVDGVAYQTAKACVFGLFDICRTASHEAPTSSVIRGICAAVFVNVLTFFSSTFEGKDIYNIDSQEILKLQEPMEFLDDMKQENSDDNAPVLYKLLRFRAICLLSIFCSFPKNLLAACFELLASGTDAVLHQRGHYFLCQVTSELNGDVVSKALMKINDDTPVYTDSDNASTEFKGAIEVTHVSNACKFPEKSNLMLENCFIGMAISKDPSLRGWILSRYKKLHESVGFQDISGISSILEKIFGSLSELSDEAYTEDNDDHISDPSKYVSPSYLVPKTPIRHHDEDSVVAEDVGQNVMPRQLATPSKVDTQLVEESFSRETDRSVSTKNMEIGIHEGACHDDYSTPRDLKKNHFPSPVMRKIPDHTNADLKNDYHVISSSQDAPNILPSPMQQSFAQHHAPNQILWYCDGDPASMDVFSASRQLWISSLGCDASEPSVRLQFEDFGPLDQFFIFPNKDFALIEYRSIVDAVKAREYMQGSTLWRGCLRIKFLDSGLGSRGAVDGVAVGESCHVYIGKVLNQWTKDEILRDLVRNPRLITDLSSENALLLEFWSAEEAATFMVNIRHHRRETGFHTFPTKSSILTPTSSYALNKPNNSFHDQHSDGHPFQSSWSVTSTSEIPDSGPRRGDDLGSSTPLDLSYTEGPAPAHVASQFWKNKQEFDPLIMSHGSPSRPSISTHGNSIIPPPIGAPSFVRPVHFTPSSSWDNVAVNPPFSSNQSLMPSYNRHVNAYTPVPFIPSSITPLSHMPSTGPPVPPPSDGPPPFPSYPPLPLSHPPSVPPPPSSPPPYFEPFSIQSMEPRLHYQWQGTLSKSGVHYCTVYATREDSATCRYSNNTISEPIGWPAKLDVTKRTDLQHVKITFTSTLPSRREVCRLLPCAASDQKGFHDFISYLKQRECAGVIKIPAGKSTWAKLLFILPHSPDICALLAIAPYPAECLIALVLPKETNPEAA